MYLSMSRFQKLESRGFFKCGSRVSGGDPDKDEDILLNIEWFPRERG